MTAKSTAAAAKAAAQSDLGDAISGAEDMLAQAASATGEKAAELRGRALEQLKALRERLQDAQATALKQGKAAALATDDYVHDNPWRSILAAASVGVVIGLLIGRR
jgi:ElaB/YqjD/DUF883 family membrane-anchored ribosome-binding protein